jgi:hypothetical protein
MLQKINDQTGQYNEFFFDLQEIFEFVSLCRDLHSRWVDKA